MCRLPYTVMAKVSPHEIMSDKLKMLIYFLGLMCLTCGQEYAFSKPIIKKCCPEDEGLSRMMNGSFSNYECVKSSYTFEYGDENTMHLGISGEYNVESGFPAECVSYDLDEVLWEDTEPLPQSYCLDRVFVNSDTSDGIGNDDQNDLIVLSCNPKNLSGYSEFALKNVRKCCPEESIYNISSHACVQVKGNPQLGTYFRETNYSLFRSINRQALPKNVTYGLECRSYAMVYINDLFEFEMRGEDMHLIERSTGRHIHLKQDEFCVDENERGSVMVRGCQQSCDYGTCIHKCCPDGEIYLPLVCGKDRAACRPNTEIGFSPKFYDIVGDEAYITIQPEKVGLHYGIDCSMGRYILDSEEDGNYLDAASGRLFLPNFTKHKQWHDEYCMEVVDKTECGGDRAMSSFLCFPDLLPPPYKFTVGWICVGISCIFLFATLVVYLSLPELRNLHGKTLMCHVISMLTAYVGICRVQYGDVESRLLCTALGYTIYSGCVAAFSWLNIMCFDIWWTFGSVKTVHVLHRPEAETRRFIFYSLYAWGLTFVLTCMTLLLDFYPISIYLDADIGKSFCWFGQVQNYDSDYPHYILFVLPMGVLIAINVVLFVVTAAHCSRVKNEIHRLQAGSLGDRCKRRFLADKAKYALNLKLFIVMGVSWVWEIASTVISRPHELVLAGDLINMMLGIPIFCILVLKPKVYRLIKKKFGIEKVIIKRNRNSSSTNRTISTQISRTTSSDDRKSLRQQYSAATSLCYDARGKNVTP